jgi:acyl-CoA dehydrogenase
MAIKFSEELDAMLQATHELVHEFLIPLEPEVDRAGKVPEHAMQKLKDLGYYGITIPEEYGGQGLGILDYCAISTELAQAHVAYTHELGVSNGIGSHAIMNHGNEEQKRYWLPRIANGQVVTAFALTEPQAGSDAANIQTNAVRHKDGWLINGTKMYITNALNADIFTVIALTDKEKRGRGGITAFLEPVKKCSSG